MERGGDVRRLRRWGWGSTGLGRRWRLAAMSKLGLESSDLGCQLGDVFFGGHGEVTALGVSRLKLSSTVRAHLRPGTCYVLVLVELRCICGMGTQGDKSLLNAWAEMRRKLSSHSAQVWLYITGGQHRERS